MNPPNVNFNSTRSAGFFLCEPAEKKEALAKRNIQDLKNRLEEINNDPLYQTYLDLKNTAPHYRDEITCRQKIAAVVIISLLIGGIVVFGLFVSNHLLSFPQDFLNLFNHVNYLHLGLTIGVPVILVTGAGIIIHRTRTKKEELLGPHNLKIVTYKNKQEGSEPKSIIEAKDTTLPDTIEVLQTIESDQNGKHTPRRGNFANIEDKLETVLVKCEAWGQGISDDYYVDMSTLDESGKALMYSVKDAANHYLVSTIVPFLATPVLMIGTIVYNLFRAVIIPFYVLVQWLREKCTDKQLYPKERPFEFADIFKEVVYSVWRVVKAPFYALAYQFAYLYSWVNPMGGRKLISALHRDWSEGATLEEGFWLAPLICGCTSGKQKFWKFEGGGGPKGLGHNGTLFDACQQPTGYVIFSDTHEVISYRMNAHLDPRNEIPMRVLLRSNLEKEVDLHRNRIEQLISERKKIKKILS